jgi:hypothetical protein
MWTGWAHGLDVLGFVTGCWIDLFVRPFFGAAIGGTLIYIQRLARS